MSDIIERLRQHEGFLNGSYAQSHYNTIADDIDEACRYIGDLRDERDALEQMMASAAAIARTTIEDLQAKIRVQAKLGKPSRALSDQQGDGK